MIRVTRASDSIFVEGTTDLLERPTDTSPPPQLPSGEEGDYDRRRYRFTTGWPNWSPEDTENFNRSVGAHYPHMGVMQIKTSNRFWDPDQDSDEFMKNGKYQAYFDPQSEEWHAISNGQVAHGGGFDSLRDHLTLHLGNYLGRSISPAQVSVAGLGGPQDETFFSHNTVKDYEHPDEWTKGATYQWKKNPWGQAYHLDRAGDEDPDEFEEEGLTTLPSGYWKHIQYSGRGGPDDLIAEGHGGKEEAWNYWKSRRKPVAHTWTLGPDTEFSHGWEPDEEFEGVEEPDEDNWNDE